MNGSHAKNATLIGLLTLATFAFVPTPATSLVCLSTSEGDAPCIDDALCTGGSTGSSCLGLVEECTQGAQWKVTVRVNRLGPNDAVLGQVICNGKVLTACSVDFFDLDRTCSSPLTTVQAEHVGARGCPRTDFDNPDGISIDATHNCVDPPALPIAP